MTTQPNVFAHPLPLQADEPILSRSDDLLDRSKLVRIVVQHVLATKHSNPVILALNSPWGSGKSSLLNLLQEDLTTQGEAATRPIVVRFNPWNYNNIDQLVRMLFAELALALGTASKSKSIKRIAKLLHASGSIAAVFSSGTGVLLKDVGKFLEKEKTLTELKQELNQLLVELGRRIVIFVDDIDRLEKDSLRLLFRLIRLNADFSNTTYVLAFDRLIVEKNLDEDNGIRGRDYLEKIIQVVFDIPPPEPVVLQRILFKELDGIIAPFPEEDLDKHRWGNLFHSGFKNHFTTIRHIKRYANGLRLTLGMLGREIDLVDYLAIELLRIFHPEIYRNIQHSKELFIVNPIGSDLYVREVIDDLAKQFNNVIAPATPDHVENVRAQLREIFPELKRIFDNTSFGHEFRSQWRKQRRICSWDMFERYFLLDVPEEEISESVLRAFVANLTDEKEIKDAITKAIASGSARRLLERLEDYTDGFDEEQAFLLAFVLLDLGDNIRFESRGMFDIGSDIQVGRIIYQSVLRIPSQDKRVKLFEAAIESGQSVGTLLQEIGLSRPEESKQHESMIQDLQAWEGLKTKMAARLEQEAKTGSLWSAYRLPYVLHRWLGWDTSGKAKAAIGARLKDDSNLLLFVESLVTTSHSATIGDKVSRTKKHLTKEAVEPFIPFSELELRLNAIASSNSDNALAVNRLLDLLQKGDSWSDV